MSSPTSDASSSRDTLDDRNDQLQQSTKDRRRERNRLAAQKHRLRRNERMSQLEAQVLALQQEKHALLARIERDRDPSNVAAAAQSQEDTHHSRSPKRARTDRALDHVDAHQTPNAQSDYVARLEERIVELERWTEELDGALSDTRDSETRWRDAYAEEHRALKYADAHAGRLASDLRTLEAERLVHLRELADLKDDLDTQYGTVRSLRAENLRLTECLEGVEVALDLQRVENDKLRDRLAEDHPRGSSMERRLAEDLEDTQRELEKSRAENDRLRMTLEDMHAHSSMRSSASDSLKMRSGSSASTKHNSRNSSPSVDAEQYINELKAKLAHTQTLMESQTTRLVDAEKEVDVLFRERYRLNEHVSSLENRLDKISSDLAAKGITLELE